MSRNRELLKTKYKGKEELPIEEFEGDTSDTRNWLLELRKKNKENELEKLKTDKRKNHQND